MFTAVALAGCATVNPTLAPARVLRAGRVAFDLGTAYEAPLLAAALTAAHAASREIASGNDTPANRDALAQGAVAFAQTPVGLAPYVSGRVGLEGNNEAHFAVMGRAARLGARHRFWTDRTGDWALTLGLQVRAAPVAMLMDATVPGVSVTASWLAGGDLALVVGRTSSELYDLWLGVRAGYTHGEGSLVSTLLNGGAAFGATLDRVDAALTFGLRVGFGHLAGMIEIDLAGGYYRATASFGASASGGVLALVPAAALRLQF